MTKPQAISAKRLRKLLDLGDDDDLPTIAKIAHVSDQNSGEAFFDLAFRSEAGKWKMLRVPRELVSHYSNRTRDLLSKYDAALPRISDEVKALLKALADQEPPNWWSIAPALGWHAGGTAFVLQDRVLGRNGDGKSRGFPKLVPPDGTNAGVARVGRVGDLATWKKDVASAARWSSPVALALSAAFAALLLQLTDWPNFMIVLHGPGKVGKSTAALAGASVIGIGLEQDMPNWNLTPAALQEIAPRFNDQLMILNGLESTKSKASELREFLRSVTYILGDGVGTRRHSSWSAGSSGDGPAAWRSIVLVTSEQSFDEIAQQASEARRAGERARAINVAAIGAIDATIIDFFPKNVPASAAKRREWARKKVEALRAACAENHGVALQPFLAHLMKMNREELREEVLTDRDLFVAAVKKLVKAEAQNHAAKNMGLVYAGGVQAIRAGLLPLTEEQLLKRLVRCFKRSLPTSSSTGSLSAVLRQFDEGLAAAVDDASASSVAATLAISKRDGSTEFTVHVTELFSTWFDGDRDACATALRWLSDEDLLVVRDRAAAERAGFTIDSVRHTRRIKGRSCAAIVFRDPRPRLKLS